MDLRDAFGGADDWDGRMLAGFTAGTGRVATRHAITSWHLHEVARETAKATGDGWFAKGLFGS